MERVRPLTVAAALVFALAGTGCVTVDPTAKTVKLSVAPESPPPPATQFECLWQRRLAPLDDPNRDGRKVIGLPGQMFLFTSDGSPAEIAGDLGVMVYDETQRPNGVAPHKPEMWHFTQETLKRLVTSDERFGRTYALFLPWPPHWKDVTTVRIAARYVGQDKVTNLTTNEVRITLDQRAHDAPVWMQTGAGQPIMSGPTPGMYDQFGVPDPTRVLQQARGPATIPQPMPVQPAGGMQTPIQPLAPPSSGPQPIPIPARSW